MRIKHIAMLASAFTLTIAANGAAAVERSDRNQPGSNANRPTGKHRPLAAAISRHHQMIENASNKSKAAQAYKNNDTSPGARPPKPDGGKLPNMQPKPENFELPSRPEKNERPAIKPLNRDNDKLPLKRPNRDNDN